MMQTFLPRSRMEEFERAAAARREDIVYREKTANFETRERERREDQRSEDKRQDADGWDVIEQVLASSENIAAFRVRLDDYDAKTVESLMDNQEALERIRQKLNDMLDEAYVLPDGRRVFKTMDGQRVFDEHGAELTSEVIDPLTIGDERPRWETFKAEVDERVRLTEERQQLLDYQTRLDDARERLDTGEITAAELDEMKGELSDAMPEPIRRKLGLEAPGDNASQSPVPSEPSQAASNLDSLMRQTGLGPSPSI